MINFKFLILGVVFCLLPDILNINSGLDYNAKIALRLMILMIFFWLTETMPNSITALMPIVFSPFFLEISLKNIVMPYASTVVFLLLGGFLLANGFEKSNLHQRIAIKTILLFGQTKEKLILCFILSTAFFSMWLSNTATCLLMLPIAKFIVDDCFKNNTNDSFSKILLLSIAYSSSIGGMSTPIGTIPNAVMVSFLNENYNFSIDFVSWFVFMIPIVLFLLMSLWAYFKFILKSVDQKVDLKSISEKYKSLGRFSQKEKISAFVLIITSMLWIFKNGVNSFFKINLTDSGIAIMCAVLFFILPVDKKQKTLLNIDWFKDIPWNVLLLFGGGLSMASIIVTTGLAEDLSRNLDFISKYNFFFILLFLTFFTSVLTEFTSNTATTFLLLPIFASFAMNNDLSLIKLILPIVLAASCAFMMPISTPPNAIVFSTNRLKIRFMLQTGFIMNIIAVSSISIYVYFFGNLAFG
tara:strand:+ start:3375 stop:4778 length:1404 start_codon:yes stop_codon:yes gene_type:complete